MDTDVALPAYEAFAALATHRRTSMVVDQDRPVPTELIDELCQLAMWAPNHKRTWPWRFAAFTGESRHRLGSAMVDDMVAADFGDDGKRAKTLTKYSRTPAVLVVGSAAHDNAMLHAENRDAVAAGVQNLLLGATTLGLATFWSTPAITQPPSVLDLCEFEPDTQLVGIIYLGWATQACAAPERPPVDVHHLD
ncbi:MAG: nitroreductase family protein [Actinomycetota bacterium]